MGDPFADIVGGSSGATVKDDPFADIVAPKPKPAPTRPRPMGGNLVPVAPVRPNMGDIRPVGPNPLSLEGLVGMARNSPEARAADLKKKYKAKVPSPQHEQLVAQYLKAGGTLDLARKMIRTGDYDGMRAMLKTAPLMEIAGGLMGMRPQAPEKKGPLQRIDMNDANYGAGMSGVSGRPDVAKGAFTAVGEAVPYVMGVGPHLLRDENEDVNRRTAQNLMDVDMSQHPLSKMLGALGLPIAPELGAKIAGAVTSVGLEPYITAVSPDAEVRGRSATNLATAVVGPEEGLIPLAKAAVKALGSKLAGKGAKAASEFVQDVGPKFEPKELEGYEAGETPSLRKMAEPKAKPEPEAATYPDRTPLGSGWEFAEELAARKGEPIIHQFNKGIAGGEAKAIVYPDGSRLKDERGYTWMTGGEKTAEAALRKARKQWAAQTPDTPAKPPMGNGGDEWETLVTRSGMKIDAPKTHGETTIRFNDGRTEQRQARLFKNDGLELASVFMPEDTGPNPWYILDHKTGDLVTRGATEAGAMMRLDGPIEAPSATKAPTSPVDAIEAPQGINGAAEAVVSPPKAETTGLANQVQERELELIAPPEKGVTRKAAESHDEGSAAVKSGEINPEALAREIAQGERPFSWREAGALLEGKRRLVNEVNAARNALSASPGEKLLIEEYEVAKVRLQEFVDNVQKGKTEWHNTGVALQAGTDLDTGNYAEVIAEAGRYKKLSAKQDAEFERLTSRIGEQDAQIQALEKQLVEAQAETTTAAEARRARRQMTREQIAKERESIHAEIDSILKELTGSAHDIGHVAYEGARFTYAAGKLAVNYMKEGVVTLDEVVERVIADFAARGVQVARDDVLADIAEVSKGKPRTKSEIQSQIAALKREARSNAQAKTQIEDLRRQLSSGDYAVPTQREKLTSRQLENLRAQRDLLKSEIEGRIDGLKPKTSLQKASNILNLPKTLRSSLDISATGRQGWLLATAHPVSAAKAFASQIKALGSAEAALRSQNALLERPNAHLYKRGNLYLSTVEGAGKGEEAYSGKMFREWRRLNPFRASERAYNAFLNRLRADAFDQMVRMLGPDPSAGDLRAIGNYVNVASGRGGSSVGLDKAADFLNNALFSPRYVASRFEYAMGQPLLRLEGSAKVRAIVAQEYARTIGAVGMIIYLAQASGAEVNTDPDASDFLKIKLGDTRIDVLAGLQQAMVFLHRLGAQRYVSAKGNETDMREGGYGKMDTEKVAARFGRSKASPTIGTAISLQTGKDYLGRDYGIVQVPADLFAPLSIQETAQGLMADGWGKEDALSLLNFLGFGVQTHRDEDAKDRPN